MTTPARLQRPKPKPKPTKYSWLLSPKGMICYRSPAGGQHIHELHEAETLTSFHDAELARATKEINKILTTTARNNKDSSRELSFIEFQDRLFLVWATHDAVSPYDDDDVIAEALGLKAGSRSRARQA